MKNTIAKSITAIVFTGLIASPAAMAAGKTDLVIQELGSQHISKAVVQQAQQKNRQSNLALQSNLDKNISQSINAMNKHIDQKLAKQLS